MTTPKQMEPNVNNALGNLLKGMMPTCTVLAENTQTFTDHPGRHADVLVTATGRSPVVVEAEFEPAPEAEKDARERLGLRVNGEPRAIEAAVALRYPAAVERAYDLDKALREVTLSYCVLYEDGTQFPESGWLQGSVEDLADLVRLVSVPQKEVEQAADTLEGGIEDAATDLDKMSQSRPDISTKIASLLGMADVPQTRRMACAILANALIFHERIAGMHEDVNLLLLLGGSNGAQLQDDTLEAWGKILDIDYYPIFAIARDILTQLPAEEAAQVMGKLRTTARNVNATGVDNAHDLTGRIFQRLIADRKYLATFYTRPTSAALLAELAVAKLEGMEWGDAEALGKLRVGDFACGTGALLSAVYEQIAARHERAGGDVAKLHPVMMQEVLYGCDVMPSAIHITGSTLSGLQPNIDFNRSRLYTMSYGRQPDGTVKIGSLELMQSSKVMTLFNTSDPALQTGSLGEETAAQVNVDIPDGGFDLVIMNPPFTRATNHGGSHSDVSNPVFAAFEAGKADMDAMGGRLNQLGKDGCYHGNAGIASAFAALADKKLKPGGVLALVLPLVSTTGLSWRDFRLMITEKYTEMAVLSIAANDVHEMSFSADTGLGECLIIARKLNKNESVSRLGQFASLTERPRGLAPASAVAKGILNCNYIRGIQEGPYGGTPLMQGEHLSGELLLVECATGGTGWGAVRVSDFSVAQAAHALSISRLWLPGEGTYWQLATDALGTVGELGLVDRDINGPAPRGPFTKHAGSSTAIYPVLWNHDAKLETRIICAPDSSLRVNEGMEEKAGKVWATASRSHLNRDLRFNSQPLAACLTNQVSLGGRSWPNVIFEDKKFDSVFSVWSNCTLGLLAYWWHSSRQDSGRGSITIRSAETLPVLDFRTLTDAQLTKAEKIFKEFRDKDLMPAYLADADPNRALLDRRVVCDLLGFDESVYQGVRRLAEKWCAEPSVHGGKPRPTGAKFVM